MTPLPKRRRVPLFLAITLFTAVIGAAGTLIAARRAVDDVPRVAGVSAVLDAVSGNIENYLLVGSDSRALGDPNTGDVGEVTGNRSDTIMLLRLDNSTDEAALLSIPRDLYIETAIHTGRINSAYNDGPSVLVQAVQQALALPIHHYVEIDFYGFKALVEALGGVEVCFALPTRDLHTGLNIGAPGCFLLDGTQAMTLIVIAAVWKQISYNFLFFLAGLQSIPKSLIEAAAIDGAGAWRTFRSVIFPLLSPTTFFLLVVNVVYAFFDTFAIVDAATAGGPGKDTEILVYKVYNDGVKALDIGGSAAQSVILMTIVLLLTVVQFRYVEKRVRY